MRRFSKILTTDPKDSFVNTVISNSVSSYFEDAIKEWRLIVEDDKGGKCICGHKLIYRNVILNQVTTKVLIVGNDCISRFRSKIENIQEDIIHQAFKKKFITEWEYNFYIDILSLKKLSIKQYNIKRKIDVKIKPLILENINNIDSLKTLNFKGVGF